MDGESKIFTNVVKKWARTPLSRAKNSKKTRELNGSGGGRGKGIRGPRPFVPVGGTNRDKRGGLLSRLVVPTGTKGYAGLLSRLEPPTGTKGSHFVPVGVSNRDKRHWPLIPFPLPPPEPFSSLVFLLFLARDRGVLAHFFTTFVKIFDSPSIHLL